MTAGNDDGARRREELRGNLAQVRVEIAEACRRAGRRESDVELIAVTKTFPAADVCHLVALGVADVGENRDQEAAAKAEAVATAGFEARWHFVGRLQRNKCRSVAGYAHMVHSVDRPAIATALNSAVESQRDDRLPVLLQLSLDEDTARGGVAESEDQPLAEQVMGAGGLRLAGVMAVAPRDWEPAKAFDCLAVRASRLRQIAPEATVVSAGMSGDFETAIAYGATMIRLGGKLLGRRHDVGYPVG